MREIKFRIWDKLEQRFIFPDKGYQGHYVLSLNGRFHNLQNGSGGDEYIVQQYTGLKDSKGIEIYEGDIVEFKTPFHGNLVTDAVAFDNGSFILEDMLYNLSDTKVRVIGSIFEPPNY